MFILMNFMILAHQYVPLLPTYVRPTVQLVPWSVRWGQVLKTLMDEALVRSYAYKNQQVQAISVCEQSHKLAKRDLCHWRSHPYSQACMHPKIPTLHA